mgnify:CR=1 FL=1
MILMNTFRYTDIIGRIGGDEFCVYMKDIPSIEFLILKCQKLITLVEDLNQEFHATVSIGVALLKDDNSYDELFKKADEALYKAKENGRSQFDVLKSYGAAKLTTYLFPYLPYSFIITASTCVLGHIFPFYMKFRGGKGLACMGGFLLAYSYIAF